MPNCSLFAGRILLGCILIYIVLSSALLFTKPPLNDEGWFAAPGYNLYANGSMGTPTLDANSSWLYYDLPGIRHRTYWIMPLHVLCQVVWYKAFGFSLFTLRSMSILFGVLGVVSWFVLIRFLTSSTKVALLALALICTDYTFLYSASDGRVDMMCMSLSAFGLAAYVSLRDRSLAWALIVANTAIAASVFTHPNGVLGGLCLVVLIARYDLRRLRFHHAVACVPYIVAAVCWAVYLMESPEQFKAQFAANAEAIPGLSRLQGLANPPQALLHEVVARYLGHYWFYPTWAEQITIWNLAIPLIQAFGFFAVALTSQLRKPNDHLLLVVLCLVHFSFFANNGLKLQFYLPYLVPTYAALLAVWAINRWESNRKWLVSAVMGPFFALQLFSVAYLVKKDRYHREFLPAAAFIKQHTNHASVIMGSSTLGFELGFDNLIDDTRLGYGNAVVPDVIVVDRYYNYFQQSFRQQQPDVARSARLFLLAKYREAHTSSRYSIYLPQPDPVQTASADRCPVP